MSPHKLLPIEWTESAWEDLNDITDYLFAKGVDFEVVEDYARRIFSAPEHLASLPCAGKPDRMPSTREWLIKDTHYTLIYGTTTGKVCILRVMHGKRKFLGK